MAKPGYTTYSTEPRDEFQTKKRDLASGFVVFGIFTFLVFANSFQCSHDREIRIEVEKLRHEVRAAVGDK